MLFWQGAAVAMVTCCSCYIGVVTYSDICWYFPTALLGQCFYNC